MPVSAEEAGNDKLAANGELGNTGKPVLAIHLHGALTSLLRLACGLPVHEVVGAAGQMQKAPQVAGRSGPNSSHSAGADSQHIDTIGELILVAGAGYNHNLRGSQVKMVAGTGVDHNLQSTPVKMVAGARTHHNLRSFYRLHPMLLDMEIPVLGEVFRTVA